MNDHKRYREDRRNKYNTTQFTSNLADHDYRDWRMDDGKGDSGKDNEPKEPQTDTK